MVSRIPPTESTLACVAFRQGAALLLGFSVVIQWDSLVHSIAPFAVVHQVG